MFNYNIPSVVTPTESKRFLKISISTIYKLISNGDIKVVRIGRVIRIPRASLVEFLEQICDNDSAINEIAVGKECK